MENTNKKKSKGWIVAVIILVWLLLSSSVGLLAFSFMKTAYENANIEVHEQIGDYEKYMSGENAKEEYRDKWGMDETIFPDKIKASMDVKDYKMVYYNPWDAQYLGYLVVDYNKEDYKKEVKRLKKYKSTKYKGYYGVTGFDKKYTLLAMYADSYQGFVYALTDNKDTIIYVEIIF